MLKQTAFMEDEMEERTASLRHRIPNEKRQECLRLFEQGYGYKKTAQLAEDSAARRAECLHGP